MSPPDDTVPTTPVGPMLPVAPVYRHLLWWWPHWHSAWRRWSWWSLLVALVVVMLVTLVWLAGRYEASVVQSQLERDATDAVADIRTGLARNLQNLQALQTGLAPLSQWQTQTERLLHEHRELARIEWRDPHLLLRSHAESPFAPLDWQPGRGDDSHSDLALACAHARRLNGPAYSGSYFLPHGDGLGAEVIELCLPLSAGGPEVGYLVATYRLQAVLAELVGHALARSQEVSFTEADGTRLAMVGAVRRGSRAFTAQQLLDLPGNRLVLRMDRWHTPPSVFPNVLTALVTAMSIALVTVLAVLVRDNRRRLRAESDLGDALAFRKAMEDSLITGLRARDLQGHTTYINPAFCEMVGFSAEELLGQSSSAPYWPPELVEEYRQRHAVHSAGQLPPREGVESVFMHKNGTRFPVLIIEAPLINAAGQHTGWMSAFLDISEQKRVEELSRASQERLQATARLATVGEMASLLSHELNQPLAAIASYANGSLNLLHSIQTNAGAALPPPTQTDLEDVSMATQRIANQAERAGRVIKSVHDFVRRRDQARESVAAQTLLDAVLPLVQLQARKLTVRVQVEVEPDLPPLWCDRTMVEQVLLNLTRNAMQAMDTPDIDPRVLWVQVRRAPNRSDGSGLEFAVADRGMGLTDHIAQRLFTPFFTTRPEGMGLGLSLCRTVVEQHGGALAFAPNHPRGTVFTFTLPTTEST